MDRLSYEEMHEQDRSNLGDPDDPALVEEFREFGSDCHGVIRFRDGEPWGSTFVHRCPDGTACGGWLPFAPHSPEGWTLEQLDPLTISPSVLCRHHDFHGFIRQGQWVSV